MKTQPIPPTRLIDVQYLRKRIHAALAEMFAKGNEVIKTHVSDHPEISLEDELLGDNDMYVVDHSPEAVFLTVTSWKLELISYEFSYAVRPVILEAYDDSRKRGLTIERHFRHENSDPHIARRVSGRYTHGRKMGSDDNIIVSACLELGTIISEDRADAVREVTVKEERERFLKALEI